MIRRRSLFVDTSAWYALADVGDRYHAAAAEALRVCVHNKYQLVTTNQVMGESYTLIRLRLGHKQAMQFLRLVGTSGMTTLVFVTQAWEEMSQELLGQYAEHDFSYVDATSFTTMRRLGLAHALAFDRHFAVAGFQLVRDADAARQLGES